MIRRCLAIHTARYGTWYTVSVSAYSDTLLCATDVGVLATFVNQHVSNANHHCLCIGDMSSYI